MANRTSVILNTFVSAGDLRRDEDDVVLRGHAKDRFLIVCGYIMTPGKIKKVSEAVSVIGRRVGGPFFAPGEIGIIMGRDWTTGG